MIDKKYFCIALLGHALILLGIVSWVHSYTSWMSPVIPSYLRDQSSLLVSSLQADSKTHESVSQQKKLALHPQNQRVPKALSSKKLNQPAKRIPYPDNILPKQNQSKQLFLQILHAAIAAKQYYPESALEEHLTGTVRIRFLIHPNGRFSQFNIQKSSGHSRLDTAALNALKTVPPPG